MKGGGPKQASLDHKRSLACELSHVLMDLDQTIAFKKALYSESTWPSIRILQVQRPQNA